MPTIDMGGLRTRAPLAVGVGCASVAGSSLWRSKPSSRFACLAISTDARKLDYHYHFPHLISCVWFTGIRKSAQANFLFGGVVLSFDSILY